MILTNHVPSVQMHRNCIRVASVFLLLVLLTPYVGAQQQSPDFSAQLNNWQTRIKNAETALEEDFKTVDSATVKSRLKQVIQQAGEIRSSAEQRLQAIEAKLDKLGKAPAKDQPEEVPKLASLRKELQQQVSEARAHAARADLVIARANELLSAIAAWKQTQVATRILQRSPPPISLSVWRQAAVDAMALADNILTRPIAWWQTYRASFGLLWALLLPLLGLVIGWLSRHFILARFGRDPTASEPGYARRIVAAFADGLANAIIPVAIILLVTVVLAWLGDVSGLFVYPVYVIAVAIAVLLTVFGLARTALSPRLVQWRIVPVEPAYTSKLLHAVGTVAGLLAIAMVLIATAWTAHFYTPELEAAFFLIQSALTALALAWLLTPKYWAPSIAASQRLGTAEEHAAVLEAEGTEDTDKGSGDESVGEPRWIRFLHGLRWFVLLTPILALAGYGRLAFHLQSRLVATGALIWLVLLLRLALREVLQHVLAERQRKRRERSGRNAASDDIGVRIMVYWVAFGIDILLLVPLVYLLLLIYGVPPTTLGLWTQVLLAGITIGKISLSLEGVLLALGVLVLVVLTTNLVRRWVTTRLLPNTRLDSGARDSIAAGTSYVGVAIAIVLAVATLGIDFSKLALIIGALSLGIGFGLQNVVHNFAAGILLLIERPIKVGDWIVAGTTEGTVKRISVRSTEVETFERSTVFVPNSELIANHVTNWTHGNRMARLTLPVRAAYGSNPRQVEEILLRCAREQQQVLRFPKSYVWFRGFGESALDFELRVYIRDTNEWDTADSGLYFAIEAAFREAGIIIPFPQRDLHIRSDPNPNGQSRLEPRPMPDGSS